MNKEDETLLSNHQRPGTITDEFRAAWLTTVGNYDWPEKVHQLKVSNPLYKIIES